MRPWFHVLLQQSTPLASFLGKWIHQPEYIVRPSKGMISPWNEEHKNTWFPGFGGTSFPVHRLRAAAWRGPAKLGFVRRTQWRYGPGNGPAAWVSTQGGGLGWTLDGTHRNYRCKSKNPIIIQSLFKNNPNIILEHLWKPSNATRILKNGWVG